MPKPRKSAPVVVYSAQLTPSEKFPVAYHVDDPGRIVERLSVADAAAQVDAGHAKWLRGGIAIQLLELARAERMPLPSTITASEMLAAAGGQRNARRKVDAWGQLQEAFLRSLVAPA